MRRIPIKAEKKIIKPEIENRKKFRRERSYN